MGDEVNVYYMLNDSYVLYHIFYFKKMNCKFLVTERQFLTLQASVDVSGVPMIVLHVSITDILNGANRIVYVKKDVFLIYSVL